MYSEATTKPLQETITDLECISLADISASQHVLAERLEALKAVLEKNTVNYT
jgi:hypothetical protein